MPLSTYSLLVGLVAYVIGLPMLLAEKQAVSWYKKFMKSNEPLISVTGLAAFLLSALVLRSQWRISPDAEGLVVLMAWFLLFKGLFVAWQPSQYGKWALHVLTTHKLELLYGFLAVVWGALFTYLGFVLI